jgi:predicted transcriptional regulator
MILMCYNVITNKHNEAGMNEATFTFRVENDLKSSFSEAAKAHDQTGAQLIRNFMRDYVKQQQIEADYDIWFKQQVGAGIQSANAGNLMSSKDIEAEFSIKRAETRSKLKSQ